MSSDSSDDNRSSDEDTPIRCDRRTNQRVDKYQSYLAEYRRFEVWCNKKNKFGHGEEVLLDFFTDLSEKHKPTTLWSTYSKLKLVIKNEQGTDLSQYQRVLQFLKDKNRGYKSPKDYSLLTNEQIRKFLLEAKDEQHLANKVVMIFGMTGSVNRNQLVNMDVSDIHELGQAFRVMVRDCQTNLCCRAFVIGSEFYPIVKKYAMLRPKKVYTDRFFLNYQRGKCTQQPIGVNKMSKVPQKVAEFLKLPNAHTYNGRGLRALQPVRVRSKKKKSSAAASINLPVKSSTDPKEPSAIPSSSQGKNSAISDAEKNGPEQQSSKSEREINDEVENISDDDDDEDDDGDDDENAPLHNPEAWKLDYKKSTYECRYNAFNSWRTANGVTDTNQSTLLTYFESLSEKFKPTTMYSIFSILKMTLMEKENIDISGYSELTFFLKCMAEGYKPKKAEVLSDQNMSDFLHFANDEKYLCCKIILIFGIAGGCRNTELKQIRFSDVEEHGQMYRVKIPLCKTEYSRTFFIYEEFFPIVKKYIDLRPKELSQENSRFLLNYQNGRCTKQPIGKHKLAAAPKQIAEYLNLPNPTSYTSHCFRRTSTTALSSIRANLLTLMQNERKNKSVVSSKLLKPSQRFPRDPLEIEESTSFTNNNSSPFESCFIKQEDNTWSSEKNDNTTQNFGSNYQISSFPTMTYSCNNVLNENLNDTDADSEDNEGEDDDDNDNDDDGGGADDSKLPRKSQAAYQSRYEEFVKWRNSLKLKETNEKVLLNYFEELSTKYAPATLWVCYSMLKAMLMKKEDLNLENYPEISKFIRNKQASTKPRDKNEGVLKPEHICSFINQADDERFLATKVILIFGISGACSAKQLRSIKITDIKEHGTIFRVNLTSSKNRIERSFIVHEEFYPIVKKYLNLRPTDGLFEKDFFLNYQHGRCTKQAIGKNKIASVPKQVALYLKLCNPKSYTGCSFRRTAVAMKANAGSNLMDLQACSIPKSDFVIENEPQDPLDGTDTTNVFDGYFSQFETCFVKQEEDTSDNDKKDANCVTPEMQLHSSEEDNSEDRNSTSIETENSQDYEKLNPAENKARFLQAYQDFTNWRKDMQIESTNEMMFFTYFEHLSRTKTIAVLNNIHTMLKTMLILEEGIDINIYSKVNSFLRDMSCKPEKRGVFTYQNFSDFIDSAPDKYLAKKVVLIFGIAGGCLSAELKAIKLCNVKDMAPIFCVTIPVIKAIRSRSFTVHSKFYDIIKRYIDLRPKKSCMDFFLQYSNGQYLDKPMSEDEIANTPKEIADYLNLPQPQSYSGDCFRQSKSISTHPQFKSSNDDNVKNGKIIDFRKVVLMPFKPILLKSNVNVAENNKKESFIEGIPSKKGEILTSQNHKDDSDNVSDKNSPIVESTVSDENSDDDCIVVESGDDDNDNVDGDDSGKVERLISKSTYNNRYTDFVTWRSAQSLSKTTEPTLMKYFEKLSLKYTPSTLKSVHSMLKTMLMAKEKINVENYTGLNRFLKSKAEGFKSTPKCEGVLEVSHIRDFLNMAPNSKYLGSKIILIVGITGACRATELKNIKINDVKEYGQIFHVNLPGYGGKPGRSFIINEEFYPFVKQYIDLRPENISDFFLKYQNGRISKQPIGLHKIANTPRQIAEYLELANPNSYGGHCFRKSQTKDLLNKMLMNKMNISKQDNETYIESRSTIPKANKRIIDSTNFSNNDESSQFESLFVKEEVNSETEECMFVEPKLKKAKIVPISDFNDDLMHLDECYPVPEVVMNEPDNDNDGSENDEDDDDVDEDGDDSNNGEEVDSDESSASELNAKTSKSKTKCSDKYEEFVSWRETMGITNANENTLLAYFAILSNKLPSDTLLSAYSTIKLNLWTIERINIRHYNELNQFLKRKCHDSSTNNSKKSETSTPKNLKNSTSIKVSQKNSSKSERSLSHTEETNNHNESSPETNERVLVTETCDNNETNEDQPLPKKSMDVYIKKYENFLEWRKSSKITETNEKALLDYFKMLSKKFQPSSLMSIYSMLRIMLKRKEKLDIKKFSKLSSFIRTTCKGYKPKEVESLSVQNVCDFLQNAPDYKYLCHKVILIFGISSNCKAVDLKRIKFKNVKQLGKMFRITRSKKNKNLSFVIHEDFYPFIKRYIDLRPKDISYIKDFFINYQDGRCTRQVVGQHKISRTPRKVAEYLNLPNPESYTGHSYRQTSGFVLADVRANLRIQELKKNDLGNPSSIETVSLPEETISLIESLSSKQKENSSLSNSSTSQLETNSSLFVSSLLQQEINQSLVDACSPQQEAASSQLRISFSQQDTNLSSTDSPSLQQETDPSLMES